MDHYRLFINGEFVEAADGKRYETIDPGTGLPFSTVAEAGVADAERAIAAAKEAFERGPWPRMTPQERAEILYRFSDLVAQQTLRLAITESMDAGHTLKLSKYWGALGAQVIRNFAFTASREFPWEEEIPYSGNTFSPGRDFIRREPYGVCVGIIPWNFPASMAFWKIASSITMGNTMILKPASATPLTALIIAECAQAAGLPPGVLNVIPGPGSTVGRVLCTHRDVDKVALTGSTEVGREIMRLASDTVKKVTLELGGKSANIILEDADLDYAVAGAILGTYFHQGQVCESGTRILVSASIYDEFLEKLKVRAERLRIGYQLLPDSEQGPLVSPQQLATVETYVRIGQEEGAQLLTGGKRADVPGFEGGYYYQPTIFVNVKNSMRIAQEEIFGPVVCVLKFHSDEEAIAIANDSIYGLGGGVFSTSNAHAEGVARQLRTGTVWINNYHSFGDYCPFGGYKQSGVGRELGIEGLKEYTQVKRIHVCAFAAEKSNFTMGILSDRTKMQFVQYDCPTKVISGHGSLPSIYKEIVNLGCRRAMIVTDPGIRAAGLTKFVEDALVDFCVGVFDRISQDTDLDTVDEATREAQALQADCVVSVGGGSVIDTGKALCVTLKNGGRANDHIAINRLTAPQTPHIVIPTTSGTGSEVTNIAVIKSKIAGRKVYIVDPHIMPNVAILDPRFTLGLPKGLTVTTAMDAMTHAIEALTSVMAQPICDGMALQAIRLIRENLPKVVVNGSDEEARSQLQLAATMAGWAFTIAQVGLAHSMAHTLGVMYNVPHGAACGIVLPGVMRFNVDYAADKLALVAQALGVNTVTMDDRTAALAAADVVEQLMTDVGHPLRLSEVGVPADGLDIAAFHALCDTATLFNARPVLDPGEIAALYKAVA